MNDPPRKANRHVPWLMGIGALVLGAWFWFQFGWWQFIVGTLFVAFGWSSIKLARFASDADLSELTGEYMSEETKRKIMNRL